MQKLIHPALILIGILTGCGRNSSREQVVYSGNTAMRITHSVKDYKEWLKVYREVSDSNSWISVYVSPVDPNLVTVYELTESHEAAKVKFGTEKMRHNMKRAGVSSEPMITYFDIKYRNLPKSPKMYRVEITHDVEDYDKWKERFDSRDSIRTAMGLELRGLFIDADNPNEVGMVFATDDVEELMKRLVSEEFQKVKVESGVASKEVVTVLKMPPVQ